MTDYSANSITLVCCGFVIHNKSRYGRLMEFGLLYACLSVSVCLSVCLSVCPFVHLVVCIALVVVRSLFVCVYTCIRISTCFSVYTFNMADVLCACADDQLTE